MGALFDDYAEQLREAGGLWEPGVVRVPSGMIMEISAP